MARLRRVVEALRRLLGGRDWDDGDFEQFMTWPKAERRLRATGNPYGDAAADRRRVGR